MPLEYEEHPNDRQFDPVDMVFRAAQEVYVGVHSAGEAKVFRGGVPKGQDDVVYVTLTSEAEKKKFDKLVARLPETHLLRYVPTIVEPGMR